MRPSSNSKEIKLEKCESFYNKEKLENQKKILEQQYTIAINPNLKERRSLMRNAKLRNLIETIKQIKNMNLTIDQVRNKNT